MKTATKPVIIREVWNHNLLQEFQLINQALLHYPYASVDTEFPGTILHPHPQMNRNLPSHIVSNQNYYFLKLNVDYLKLIQLGLTLSDAEGNLPDLGTKSAYIWEFNFRDFNIHVDDHNPDSIQLLMRQGIDFWKNQQMGIDGREFALLLSCSGLVFKRSPMTWVTFHSAYDFGFLIKLLLGGRELPNDLSQFIGLVGFYFGMTVYDIKYMIKDCNGLYGGLERVAKSLGVHRVAGKSHQAGSDSLLTMQTFIKLREVYFNQKLEANNKFELVLYGLEVN
ncbi:probable CCR4-associated factor 1 homolog 11 [Cornus florida]|uniref:probable CCR4-associated factor 1 homolog 11 n=1 Tax=Cornus florida TaxID=4283 RepID=UPI00289783E5|nr:probable CCR4-associated factor 1 homolog 11 [Cornus florida]XP_059654719.1 probable CCR4-associated factor 1 homolog 11 [Cornus florida]